MSIPKYEVWDTYSTSVCAVHITDGEYEGVRIVLDYGRESIYILKDVEGDRRVIDPNREYPIPSYASDQTVVSGFYDRKFEMIEEDLEKQAKLIYEDRKNEMFRKMILKSNLEA